MATARRPEYKATPEREVEAKGGVGGLERGKNTNNNRQQTYFMADCVTIILEER